MKSLTLQTFWQSQIDADIRRKSKTVLLVYTSHHTINLSRILALYLTNRGNVHMRIIVAHFFDLYHTSFTTGSYSEWQEAVPTNSPSRNFTPKVMKKICSLGAIPKVLVMDNGINFTGKYFNGWLTDIWCRHLFTEP